MAKLWNSLPIECFPLTYDVSNRHLLTAGSFETDFLFPVIFFVLLSSNCMPRSGCSALHGVNPNLKKGVLNK